MRLRNRLYQFMQGRNGVDAFGVFINRLSFGFIISAILFTFLSLVCLRHEAAAASTVFRILYYIAFGIGIVLLSLWFFRVFSRNTAKRQAENTRYQYRKHKFQQRWSSFIRRLNPKYKYFRCPQCNQLLRAPRRKGKIQVTCSACRHVFITKT